MARHGSDVITAHALKLALMPGWDEGRAAEELITVARGNVLALRRAKARLEGVVLEHPSRVVQQAVGSLRTAVERAAPAPEIFVAV